MVADVTVERVAEARKQPGRGRLDTFVAPAPSPLLIAALAPVNRWLCLGGISGLRNLPVIGRVPGVRGLSDIREIDLPREDEWRLRSAVNRETVAFLGPNHPEFFTDWMLDKEVLARVSPLAACWATNTIVNGMGRWGQAFWLANNLIAQIPGAGEAAREHSIAWALAGRGVLLHPEGNVGWHGDTVAPLFPGIVDMAFEAARRLKAAGVERAVRIVPLVWRLQLTRSVEPELEAEMGYVERRLGLASGAGSLPLRLAGAYGQLLARDATRWGLTGAEWGIGGASFGERQRHLLAYLAKPLVGELAAAGAEPPAAAANRADATSAYDELLRTVERWLRTRRATASGRADGGARAVGDGDDGAPNIPATGQFTGGPAAPDHPARTQGGSAGVGDPRASIRALVSDMRRIQRFRPALYPGEDMTQEQIAESIKRLRYDYCSGTWRDSLNRFVPQPDGPRIAHIRVPEPIDVNALLRKEPDTPGLRSATLSQLRDRMQTALDGLAREITRHPRTPRYRNPFREA